MGSHDISTIKQFGDAYLVYSDGRIWSNKNGDFLSPYPNNRGYLTVSVYGRKRTVHRIIAECFIPNNEAAATVNHKNGDRVDNRVENLEWCSYAENNLHAWGMDNGARRSRTKEQTTGSKNPFAKLNENQVKEIIELYVPNTRGLRTQLAKKYNVSVGTIKSIVSGAGWKHVRIA